MITDYLPILILIVFAVGLGFLVIILGTIFGPRRPSQKKSMPYESGMVPYGPGSRRMNVRYYLIAVLFILFDIEAIFLYPWAVILRDLKMFGFWEMLVYIGIMLVGFFYVWKKGALDWGKPSARRGEV
jgi:NADH-quinone oxidoreductase subunit A